MRSSLHPLFLTLSHSGGCCCNCDSGEDNRRLFRYIDAKCVAALAALLFTSGKSAVCGFVQRKNGIKTNRRKMRKEATYERSEAAGKRVFYPDHGKKKGLRRDVNGHVSVLLYGAGAFFCCCSRQKSAVETGARNIDQLISNSESVIRHKRPGRIL